MGYRKSRVIKLISSFLVVSLSLGLLPLRELRADANTHGAYSRNPFSITYEQDSSWDNSTQGQFTITNTSEYDVTDWSLEIDYFDDVLLTNIWNVTGYVSNGNIIVSSNHTIEAGFTYSFGLIVEGEEDAPIAPVDINILTYVSDEPDIIPTPSAAITEAPTISSSVTISPSITPTQAPTLTPIPTEIPEEEQTIFSYAIFSGSTTNDFLFQGWKSNIIGDVYSGRNFLYQGSELYMEGYARTVGVVNPSGWITNMNGAYEGISPLQMPDWSASIIAKEDIMPSIDMTMIASQHSIYANGYLYVNGDITIDSANFSGTGDIVIVANGNITYNVDTITPGEENLTGRILLYSEEGNITINGNEIEVNGIMYAPNGRVSINAYNTTLNGRIVADIFSYNGSILNVTASKSDLELINDLPQVTVTASSSEVSINDSAYYTIEIPEDNVFEIRYRLNSEEVFVQPANVEETLALYNLNTSTTGVYILEAYVILPYGEFLLDSDMITVVASPTPTNEPTPTEEPTQTPVPTEEPTQSPTPIEEPTVTPTAAPMPTDFPLYSDIVYTEVMSQGDTRYGYETEFIEEDWNIHDNTTYSPTIIRLTDGGTYRNGYSFFNHSQHIDEDFSFSVRYTYQIDLQQNPSSDGIAFVIQAGNRNPNSMNWWGADIGYQGLNPSLEIESDVFRNSGEINNHHIALVLNANSAHHEAVADYPLLRDNDAIQNMWIDYDGIHDMLYVYAATYSDNYDAQKPSEPLITYNVDLAELFGEIEDVYIGFTSASGAYMGRCSAIGLEYGTIEFEEPVIGLATSIFRVIKGDPIEGDGIIHGVDSYIQLIDSDGNEIYNSELNPTGEYERLFTVDTTNLDEGVYTIIVTATNSAGETITKEIPVLIYTELIPTESPNPTESPDITPDVDLDDELLVDIDDCQDGEEIPYITDIIGTVSGADLQYYTFDVYPVNSDEAIYSSIGTGEIVDGILGRIDSTLLLNGYYKVIVTGYGPNQNLSDEIIVLVCGQAKVGNFSLSFLDMSMPVAGLPVEIYRTYDSRERTQNGDFGYGWNLTIGGPSISISDNLGEDWDTECRTVFGIPMYYWHEIHPHEIYIDWGNGHEEVFEVVLSPERTVSANNWVGISASIHNTSGGNNTLQFLDSHDDLIYADNCLYHSSDFSLFEPQNFLLTRYDGIKFYFSVDAGLYKVEDTYGRTIEITENGILYSDGTSIDFVRNSNGLITSISDGLGNEVIYTYDENGNLVSVLDIGGYYTNFEYDDSHYITDIIADNGTRIARNEYNDDGRLIATIDADGNRIEFTHDLDSRTEVTTNRLGYSTVFTYDERGNVLTVTDALGRVTSYTYDSNNNKTSENKPDGTSFSYSYDTNNNLLSAVDSNGRIISSTYGSNGELLTMSAMGVVELSMVYDSHGNITSATDSSGNIQEYGYSSSGELTSVSDSIGTLMNMTYDSNGNVSSITNGNGQVTNFTYDSEGRLTTRSVTYNGTTLTDRYSYDSANRVTGITYADGNMISYTYNQAGDVISSTDSEGRITSYTYDIYGNLTRIAYPDGTSESFTYDAEGQNTSSTDRMGRTSTYSYDAVGNLIRVTTPEGITCTYTYDACNRVVTATNGYGAVTTYGYDYLGRNTSVTDGLGNTTTYTYNDRGNVSSVTDANGNIYTFTYDNNGNQTSVTYPSGNTFSSTYDVRGRLTSETDGNGNTTTYSYDSLDQLISVTDANGSSWNYTYDSMGNVVSVTDANGNVTTYDYDEYGRCILTTNAAGITSTNTFDDYGRVTSFTDFGGHVTAYTYDSMDRVITSTTDGLVTTYEYDALGRVTSVTDETGTITYEYSSTNGYLTSVTNANNQTITYTYNDQGQLTIIAYGTESIHYGYDVLGRITTVTDNEGTTRYYYDSIGNLVETEYPNGVVTTYTYNENSILVLEETTDSTDTVIASYSYVIGDNNERLSVTELNRTVEYEYDNLNRLISETATINGDSTVTTYSYDANSNRITMVRDGVVTNYTYNNLNQLITAGNVTYTWDNAGNLISQSSNGVLVAAYTYDSYNRMVTASVVNGYETIEQRYTYDYLGNRTSKTNNGETTNYLTDLSSGYAQILVETTGNEEIIYTRGLELISRRTNGEAQYYLFDGGSSVRGLTDEDGVITDTYLWDAFGNSEGHTGNSSNEYGFQGEQQDETGLYYLRARYMNPSTGTFTSMDTYGGSLLDPMSLHKYMFANANPVKYTDPSGLLSLEEEELVFAIDRILDSSMMSGVMYIIDAQVTDPSHKDHSLSGYFMSLLIGAVICGILMIVPSLIASLIVIVLSFGGISKGSVDIIKGNIFYGTCEILLSLVGVYGGGQNVYNSIYNYVVSRRARGNIYVSSFDNLLMDNESARVGNHTIDSYGALRVNSSRIGEAHHTNQNAAFRDRIPFYNGVSIDLGGSISEVGSSHNMAHSFLENFWDTSRNNSVVITIDDYNNALYESLTFAGLSNEEANAVVYFSIRQQQAYGYSSDTVIHAPGRTRYARFD